MSDPIDISDSKIPAAVINIDVHLPADFAVPDALDGLRQMSVGLNKIVGIGMANIILSAAHPVCENLFKAAAHIETAYLMIQQIEQQMQQQQSKIVNPFETRPAAGPQRSH